MKPTLQQSIKDSISFTTWKAVRIDVGASVRTSVDDDIQDDLWDIVRAAGWTVIDRFVTEFIREGAIQ